MSGPVSASGTRLWHNQLPAAAASRPASQPAGSLRNAPPMLDNAWPRLKQARHASTPFDPPSGPKHAASVGPLATRVTQACSAPDLCTRHLCTSAPLHRCRFGSAGAPVLALRPPLPGASLPAQLALSSPTFALPHSNLSSISHLVAAALALSRSTVRVPAVCQFLHDHSTLA